MIGYFYMYPFRTVCMTGGKADILLIIACPAGKCGRRKAGVEIIKRIRRDQAFDYRPVRGLPAFYPAAATRVKSRACNGSGGKISVSEIIVWSILFAALPLRLLNEAIEAIHRVRKAAKRINQAFLDGVLPI